MEGSLEDEAFVRDYVKTYSNMERLTPLRSKQLLKAALGKEEPEPPADDACCGCNCCPCVKDLWREEVQLWKDVRQELEERHKAAELQVAEEKQRQLQEAEDKPAEGLLQRAIRSFTSRPPTPTG